MPVVDYSPVEYPEALSQRFRSSTIPYACCCVQSSAHSLTAAQVLDPQFSDEELSAARTQIKNELDDLNKRPEVNA